MSLLTARSAALSTWWRRGLLTVLASLCLLLPATAQEQPAGDEDLGDEEFFESVDVRVVNVEVYVTDKKGTPILGLTADDFEVFEDKRPVQITNFYAVEDRRRLGEDGEPMRPAPTVPTLEAGPVPLFDSSQQLNLIVYIDNFNLRPFNRNRVFRRLRTFLRKELNENDRVMVVSYDRSLHMRQEFTTDMTLVNSALFEMEDISAHGVHADSERNRILQAIESAEDVGDAMIQVRPHAESLFNDLSFTVTAMDEMVDSLAGLAGRKALLYVSDGLPMKAAEDLFYMVQQKFHYTPVITEMMDFDASRMFRNLGNKANANGVTFYTIDAGGLRTYSSASVEVAEAGKAGMSSFVDTVYIQSIQEPLRFLADATGGRAIINTNDISDDLLKIAADFNSYYSIGYTPAHAGDGRLHRIEVKLKDKKGRRIRHRETYRDKSVGSRMVDATLATLRYGFEENAMGVLLEVGSPQPSPDGMYHVPVKVGLPLGKLTLVPRADHYYGRARLYFGAIDDKDGISEVNNLEVPIRIPTDRIDEAQGMYYPYETTLLMRGGPHQLAIGVRDELGAGASYVKKAFFVGGG